MIHDMVDQASYMAHGYCLLWKPWLVILHAASDILIFGAYFAIPVAIWIFLRRRPDLELRPLAILFAAFIFLCGLTHLVQMVTLWWPIYETQGLLKAATAISSTSRAYSTSVCPSSSIKKSFHVPILCSSWHVGSGFSRHVARSYYNSGLSQQDKSGDFSVTGNRSCPPIRPFS